MSAYGGFFIRFSSDIQLDAKRIVSQLNKYKGWCEDDGVWVTKSPSDKCFSPFYWELKGGYCREVSFPSLNIYRVSREENQIFVTLKELSLKIAPHIKQGHFEIVCSSNDHMSYLTFEKLIIKNDGFAQLTQIKSSCMEDACDTRVETYLPRQVY